MSTRPPSDSISSLDHGALRYLRQALDISHPIDEPYVLNSTESRVIRRTKVVTLTMAALVGLTGILLYYGPQYAWPDLFLANTVSLGQQSYELPFVTGLYALLLLYFEVNLLVSLNNWGIRSILNACNFPRAHDAQYESHLQSLATTTLTGKKAGFMRFGVEPYLNVPYWGLNLFFLSTILKAALTHVTLRVLAKHSLSQLALSQLTAVVGVPIYAIWNAWSSWRVLHEAQVRVMAPATIREFANELHEEWGKNDEFRPLILEALDYLCILNHQYNYAHLLFTATLLDRFKLQADITLTGHFPERAVAAPAAVRHSLERLVVFGVLVNGNLSRFEKNRLNELRKKGLLTYSSDDISRLGKTYNQGRGLWV